MTRTVAFRQSADIVRVVTPERRFRAIHRPMAQGRSPRRTSPTLRVPIVKNGLAVWRQAKIVVRVLHFF